MGKQHLPDERDRDQYAGEPAVERNVEMPLVKVQAYFCEIVPVEPFLKRISFELADGEDAPAEDSDLHIIYADAHNDELPRKEERRAENERHEQEVYPKYCSEVFMHKEIGWYYGAKLLYDESPIIGTTSISVLT